MSLDSTTRQSLVTQYVRMTGDPTGNIAQAHLTVHNDLSELSRLSDFLAAFFTQTGLPADLVEDFELALEEVFVNAVMHGYPDGGEREIFVNIALEDGVVRLAVEDDGVPFNPLEAPLMDLDLPLEERGVGGLGIHLVKGVMDNLEYTRPKGRNRLVMQKKVRI
jgi:serine/threonine-protein kinase RsbW